MILNRKILLLTDQGGREASQAAVDQTTKARAQHFHWGSRDGSSASEGLWYVWCVATEHGQEGGKSSESVFTPSYR